MGDVQSIMSTPIVTVELDDTLFVVKDIFENVNFHHVLAVEDGVLKGVLSDRDLLKAISPYVGTVAETTRDIETLKKKVHQVMSRNPVCLKKEAEISDAVSIFKTYSFSCIPIVDDESRPIGIVTWRDIIGNNSTNKLCLKRF